MGELYTSNNVLLGGFFFLVTNQQSPYWSVHLVHLLADSVMFVLSTGSYMQCVCVCVCLATSLGCSS